MTTKQDIKRLIKYELFLKGYWDNRGRRTECFINDKYVGKLSDLHKVAKIGDDVHIDFYTLRGHHFINYTHFTLKYNEDVIQKIINEEKSRPKQPRDYQRSRVYRAERKMVNCFDFDHRSELSPENCQKLVDEVLEMYGLEADITVNVSKRLKNWSWARSWQKRIDLAHGWGQNKKVVLHEVAHIINNRLYGSRHDEYFTAVSKELYEMYLGWCPNKMMEIYQNCKVKVANI